MTKFSLIIPVYNVEKYLDRCIDSVLKQTYTNYEIILIDDGSTDQCGKICDGYSREFPNIHTIHQKNQGLSAARNEGVKYAKGEYIWFIDSDDLILRNDALELLDVATRGYSEVITFGWKEFVDSNEFDIGDEKYNFTHSGVLSGEEFLLNELSNTTHYSWYAWLYLYKRDYWIENKFEYPVGRKFEDIGLTYKTILEADSINAVDKSFYGYRVARKGSITSAGNVTTLQDGIEIVANNINDIMQNRNISIELKQKLANNFACNYFGIMILSTRLSSNDKKVIRETLKANVWVVKYSRSGKQRLAKIAVSLLGVATVQNILGIRRLLKDRK